MKNILLLVCTFSSAVLFGCSKESLEQPKSGTSLSSNTSKEVSMIYMRPKPIPIGPLDTIIKNR